jgi:hypothetical protein
MFKTCQDTYRFLKSIDNLETRNFFDRISITTKSNAEAFWPDKSLTAILHNTDEWGYHQHSLIYNHTIHYLNIKLDFSENFQLPN